MMTVSVRPPARPEKAPTADPVIMEIATIDRPTPTEARAPKITRERRSRPTSSVPKGWTSDGAASREVRLIAFGSYGASHGAKAVQASIARMMSVPAAVRGLRRTWYQT